MVGGTFAGINRFFSSTRVVQIRRKCNQGNPSALGVERKNGLEFPVCYMHVGQKGIDLKSNVTRLKNIWPSEVS